MNIAYLSILLELYIYAKLLLAPIYHHGREFLIWSPTYSVQCHVWVGLAWNILLWYPNLMLKLMPALLALLFFSQTDLELKAKKDKVQAILIGNAESVTEWIWTLSRYILKAGLKPSSGSSDTVDHKLNQVQSLLDFLNQCIETELSFSIRIQLLWLAGLIALHANCQQLFFLASNTVLLYHSPMSKRLVCSYHSLRMEVECRQLMDMHGYRFSPLSPDDPQSVLVSRSPSDSDAWLFQFEERFDLHHQTLTLILYIVQFERWWSGPGLGWLSLFKSTSVSENEPRGAFAFSPSGPHTKAYFDSLESIEAHFKACFPFWSISLTDWTCEPWEYGQDDWTLFSITEHQDSRVRRRKLFKSYQYALGSFHYQPISQEEPM